MLGMNEIRTRFIDFFHSKGHEIIRSSSLIPKDDPSLLFTNAGMVQFKKIFQGLEKRDYNKATTSQKCLRVGGKHNDLENVGRTARHHTFFEMLGNFSFGDYFKEEAIRLAWEFITKELDLPKDKLYATVFLDDDEAFDLWLKLTDIPKERIIRMGEKDNFWTMGDTGPCGPCSEILIDQGEHMTCGPECGIGKCDCDRFLEIWNLVFMQFNQLEDGTREKLAKPSIDTGMGLERIAAVSQGVFSNYDTDLFRSLIDFECQLANVSYSQSAPDTNDIDTALRVVADHSRAIAFMIADGIMPSNEGRGYVLRRLIRRAYRFGRLIGMPSSFLHKTANKVCDLMGDSFPELLGNQEFMIRLVKEEEERFEKTLDKGLVLLESEMETLRGKGITTIPGDVAFKLYDTYGFPLDIVNDASGKLGFTVDEPAFMACMAEQKERAKAAWKGSGEKDVASRFTTLLEDGLSSQFIGYDHLQGQSRIIALLDEEGEATKSLTKGQKGYLVTGVTPFYGASGGQEGDTGSITSEQGKADVTACLKAAENLTVHVVTMSSGTLHLDEAVTLEVEEGKRLASARNHTATHLLHAALRSVLGEHVHQAGSLVTPERLRFDFTHMSGMKPEDITAVEAQVNRAILANKPVAASQMTYDEAIASGAVALFGEKYGDTVRVITMDDESTELCGGTHLHSTGQAGLFTIVSESGVAANTRRIEATTGWNSIALFTAQREVVAQAQGLLKCHPHEVADRIRTTQEDLRETRRSFDKLQAQAASSQGKDLLASTETINGVTVLAAKTEAGSIKVLRELMDDLRSKVPSGILCLGAVDGEKAALIVSVSKDLHNVFTAPALIKEISPAIGGSGGGRPDRAQAGGTNPEGFDQAFTLLKEAIAKA